MEASRQLWYSVVAVSLATLGACASTPPTPPLHAAIKEGSLEAVRKRLAAGDDTSQRDANGLTPLHTAISLGRREIALQLIRSGTDLNARTRNGSTPLTLAVEKRYTDVVELLLERRAAIDSPTGGQSPLLTAVRMNDAGFVDRLLRAGADVERRNPEGESALHVASNLGYGRVVERLLAASADINAAVPDGRTPIHYAVLNNQHAVADLLYARGAAIGPAKGETGGFTTAILYRHIAERDYLNRAVPQAMERLEQAKAAFLALQPVVAGRADELANEVLKGQVLNALALFVGAAKANIDARTSLSGTGTAVVPVGSTAGPERLRDSYRGIAAWCEAEAKRMDAIKGCVASDPSGVTPCFALHPAR